MPDVKKPVSLQATRFKLAEFDRNVWSVELEAGVEFKACADTGFWAHCAAKLKRGDRIEVTPDNLTWYGELIVVDSGTNWTKTQPLRYVELEETQLGEVMLDGGRYKIEFAGKTTKHRVVDTTTKKVIKEGFRTQVEAQIWFNDWIRQQQTAKAS
jgi:hypothetical protein